MKHCKLLIIPVLVMSFALTWGVDQGRARAEEIAQPTDDAASTDSQQPVPRRKKPTRAQREEAAKRLEQQRAEQLLKETTNPTPAPNAVSPPAEKGGNK